MARAQVNGIEPAGAEGDARTTLRLLEGVVIDDRYRLLGVLGRGAMGVVYEAEHVRIGLRVAVKILDGDPAADPTLSERFRREARAASTAGHPNIVAVYDAGTLPDGRPFIVMELLRGRVLSRLLDEEGPLSAARACRIVRDMARGIEAAHRVGVIHRDLKPNNVFVIAASDAAEERVKIVDFGIALGSDTDVRMTTPGMIIGTPLYMAPEQCYAEQPRPQSDIYALGVVLFELLAGQPPFRAEKAVQLLAMKTSRVAPRVCFMRPEVPEALDELVADCLEIDPERRPASATAMVDRLDAILAVLEPSRVDLPIPPRALRSERSRPGAFMALLGVVVFSMFATWLVWIEPDPPHVGPDPPSVRSATAEVRPARVAAPSRKPEPAVPSGSSTPASWPDLTAAIEAVPETRTVEPSPTRRRARSDAERAPRDRVPAAPPSTDARPADDADSSACTHDRRAAQDCRESHDWQGVLRHTGAAHCWTSPRDRTRLRVMALMELGRFDACLREGAASTDPGLQRTLTICRLRAAKP